ncbi:MAG: hypothetical protein EOM18_13705 [Clostridia bacterium]|nr:hypothetical protein [Clostridia bacterium]
MFNSQYISNEIYYRYKETRIASYNDTLGKSMMIHPEDSGAVKKANPTAVIYPIEYSEEMVQSLKKRAVTEGYHVTELISAPKAAAIYYMYQTGNLDKKMLIRIIDIHKETTGITLLEIQGKEVTRKMHQNLAVGSEYLTEKIKGYYMEQLKGKKRDVSGDSLSLLSLRHLAKATKERMGKNRSAEDRCTFVFQKDDTSYPLSITREVYDQFLKEMLQEITSAINESERVITSRGWGQAHVNLLTGAASENQALSRSLGHRYGTGKVASYQGSDASILGGAISASGTKRYVDEGGIFL